jgi:hypothetical protein
MGSASADYIHLYHGNASLLATDPRPLAYPSSERL